MGDTTGNLFTIHYHLFPNGGGGGSRTPVRGGFGRTSTRVVNLWSRGRYADSRAYPSASVRSYESQTRERSASGQVLLNEASPPSRRPRVGRWPSVRPPERNRCSQLLFFLFFNEANRSPRRAIRSPRVPSKPNHPHRVGKRRLLSLIWLCKSSAVLIKYVSCSGSSAFLRP